MDVRVVAQPGDRKVVEIAERGIYGMQRKGVKMLMSVWKMANVLRIMKLA